MPDALADVFSLLDLRGARCTRLEAGGAWALRFPAKPALKFAAVMRGGCWIVHPDRAPARMEAGDVFLLSHTPAYVLASDPSLPALDGARVIDWETSDVGRHGGDATVLLGGAFRLDPLHARLLTDALPRLTLIPAEAPSAAALRRTLELLEAEMLVADRDAHAEGGPAPRMGAELMRAHLADMLLVQLLRAFAGREGRDAEARPLAPGGWIGALADRRIAPALELIHADPAAKLTVARLAREAGMSRSAFAAAFSAAVGRPPLDYALRWRMQVARDLLGRGLAPGQVAHRLGYASQSAFGAAYRRVRGASPAADRRAARG